mmetsp:Transcript_31661/g.70990  ORF Transcript_31661/g.70990 Transcript_31661/m.70990 type:complete len:221 (+) Transcript_31661:798-1460(+)
MRCTSGLSPWRAWWAPLSTGRPRRWAPWRASATRRSRGQPPLRPSGRSCVWILCWAMSQCFSTSPWLLGQRPSPGRSPPQASVLWGMVPVEASTPYPGLCTWEAVGPQARTKRRRCPPGPGPGQCPPPVPSPPPSRAAPPPPPSGRPSTSSSVGGGAAPATTPACCPWSSSWSACGTGGWPRSSRRSRRRRTGGWRIGRPICFGLSTSSLGGGCIQPTAF